MSPRRQVAMMRRPPVRIAIGRGSPFTPADLSDLRLWLKPGDWTTTSGKVDQWNDSSGNGHHATQGTAANRPSPITDGGLDAIEYTASTDYLVIPHTTDLQLQTGLHVMIVCKDSGTDTNVFALTKWSGSVSTREWMMQISGASAGECRAFIDDDTAGLLIPTGGDAQDGSIHLLQIRHDGSEYGWRLDNDAEATETGSDPRQDTTDLWLASHPGVGAGGVLAQTHFEVVAFVGDSNDLANVRQYINDTYSIW